jgi:hypothetical protein
MQVPKSYYDEIFDFKGQWEMPSKCGLKIIKKGGKTYVIVTELYQENTGTSVTYTGKSLKQQICEAKNLDFEKIIYLECTPNTNSVMSFYDERMFEVTFNDTPQSNYRELSNDEIQNLLQ